MAQTKKEVKMNKPKPTGWEDRFIAFISLWRPYFYKKLISKRDLSELKSFIRQEKKKMIEDIEGYVFSQGIQTIEGKPPVVFIRLDDWQKLKAKLLK